MSRALKINAQPESDWTVMEGPMNGTRLHVSSDQFAIGRSHECEISIPSDPKISRRHARVYWSEGEFRIQSLVDQNPVLIEGRPISDESLPSGTIIQLGETRIRFDSSAQMIAQPQFQVAPVISPVPTLMPFSIQAPPAMPQTPRKKRPVQGKSNITRFVIYGAIGGLLWFVLSPSDGTKKNPFAIRSEKQIEADIEEANELRKLAEKMRSNRLNPSITERQSQEHYVKGFRDFRKGQFERSIESFQACLALSPDNALCNRYLSLSRKKFNELVQFNMVLGRKYRDQNQFRACRSAFRNAMVMVRDPSSAIYKEAKSNYDACNSLVEGRF